jgi:hypothetical protein
VSRQLALNIREACLRRVQVEVFAIFGLEHGRYAIAIDVRHGVVQIT